MPTAKELKLKQGDRVTLTDDATLGIMSGLGAFLGVPAEKMNGKPWAVTRIDENNVSIQPVLPNGVLINFTWGVSSHDDAFATVKHVKNRK